MKKEEYIELLKTNRKCNFIAIAITPWHALGINAAIKKLQTLGLELHGYIFVHAHSLTGYAVNERDFTIDENIEIKYTHYENTNIRNKVMTYLSVLFNKKKKIESSDDIYVVCPETPSWMFVDIVNKAYSNKKTKFIIINEGIASISFKTIKGLYEKESEVQVAKSGRESNIVFLYIRIIVKLLLERIIEYKEKKNESLLDWDLFSRKNKEIFINSDIKRYYLETLKEQSAEIDVDAKYNGCILLNPQLLEQYEGSLIDKDEKPIKCCVDFAKKNGIPIVIKPHPRDRNIDRFSSYNCLIEENKNLPQELIMAAISEKPLCIISESSTSLITMNALFGIPSISYAKISIKEDIPEYSKQNLNNFIRLFSKTIYMPNDYNEMIEYLENLVRVYEKTQC